VSLNVSPVRTANFGVDVGVNYSRNTNVVLEWLGDEDRVGRPVRYTTFTEIINPHQVLTAEMAAQGRATARGTGGFSALSCFVNNPATGENDLPRPALQPGDSCTQSSTINHGYPQTLAPNIWSGHTTVRLPYGISLSARGEFRSGNWANINPIAIGRSVRSPACLPYYANTEDVQLKNDTPVVWVHRCTPQIGNGYNIDGDYFKLRNITATLPMDFMFPDRFRNATLTMTLGNIYTWKKDSLFGTYGIESSGNNGANDRGNGFGGSERTPPPATFRASLRVTF
jgi:hypothetical protein